MLDQPAYPTSNPPNPTYTNQLLTKPLKSNEHSTSDRTYHSSHQPIRLHDSCKNLSPTEDLKKKDKSPVGLKLTALEMIDLHYPEKNWLRWMMDLR
jgi:hypothetical protein